MRSICLVLFCGVSLFAQRGGPPPPGGGGVAGGGGGRRMAGNSSVAANPNDVAPAAVKPEDKCSVEGTVVNAVTGEALKKAQLTLRPIGVQNGVPYGATTDGGGHFLIDDVDPGKYNVAVSRNGFVNLANARGGAPLTLENGQKVRQMIVKLTPQGVISGRILDEDGEPLANVNIQCLAFGYQRGKRQLMPQNGGNTDDRGEFRLHGLRPGKYLISASYRSPDLFMAVAERVTGSPQAVQPAEEGYATTYYPNATNPESASQLDIVPGAQISGINMTLVRTQTVRIKGHVTVPMTGERRRNVNVMLMPRDNTGFMMPRGIARVIDQAGNFQMRGVTPGSYVLRADANDGNQRYSGRLPIEVGRSNLDGIELTMQPPSELLGRVVIENNGDLAGASLNIRLQPKINGPMMMGGGGGGVQPDLKFRIANVGPDPYDVNVNGLPEGFYVKSIRLGQLDVTETGVDFSQNAPSEELVITLNPNGGQVEGVAQNAKDQAAAGSTVTLIPEEGHRSVSWFYRTANADQNGHFLLKGVRPGKYKIYAWEDLEPGAYQDPDYVKPHESAGEKVEVKESGHETIQLKAIPAEK